jgi:hypothetical protein
MKSSLSRNLTLLLVLILLAACSSPIPTGTAVASREPAPPESTSTPQPTDPATPSEAAPTPGIVAPTQTTAPALPTFTPFPTALPAPYLGVSIMGIELVNANFGQYTPQVASAGAYWVRWNGILWSDVEPTEGIRIWESLATFEAQLASLQVYDLKLIAIVRSTPLWAQARPGSSCGAVSDEKLEAFGTFMFDLVSRYGGPPYNIKYWELGNEPDIDPDLVPPNHFFGCWGDDSDHFYGGGAYARMLQAVYPRIKAADPEAQVLIGGLLLDCDPVNPPETAPGSGVPKYCDPANFLEGILINGGGDYFDGVSFHAYDLYDYTSGYFGNPNWLSGHTLSGLIPVVVPKARFLRSVLANYGYFNKYLMNTETALLCGFDGSEEFCRTGQFDRMKADYVAMTYAAAQAEGLQGNVWFYLNGGWRRSGLLNYNGAPADAYAAYQFAAQRLGNALFWGQVSEFEGVYGYKFRQGEVETWVIWSLDAQPHLVQLAAPPSAVYNVFGVTLNPSQSLEVSTSPLYVEFLP